MKLVDVDLLKSILDKGEIVIGEDILQCESPHDVLVYLLTKVDMFLEKAIDGLPEYVPDINVGKWITGENGFYYCSICGHEAYWDTDYGQQKFNYCPYCGARMENGNEIN